MKKKAASPEKEALKTWMLRWVDSYGTKKFWSRLGWSEIFAMRLDEKEAAEFAAQQAATRSDVEIVPYVQPPTRSQSRREGPYIR